MDEVQIITRSVPAKPRSKNYPTGSVASSSGGGGGNITVTGGTNVDVVKTTDTKTLTDQNVLSSLRAIAEALNVFLSRVVKDKDEATEPSDEKVYSSLRTDSEIKDAVNKALESLEELYLSKVNDDTAEGLIRFLKGIIVSGTPILSNLGIKVGTFASGVSGGQIDGDGNGELLDLLLRGVLSIGNYVAGKSGAQITKEGAGELLSLVLRGILQSDNFVKGALGTGYALIKQDETGKSYLEVDKLFVRIKAFFTELEIKKLSYAGGNFIFSPAGITLSKVEEGETYYRCYFTNDDGSTATENLFRVDDLVLSQTFNIKEGIHENVGNRRYWRAVVAVGDNWFDLSKTDCEADSDVPQEGDSVVVLGNKTDASRQNAIVISVYGEGSPAFTEHKGIKTYSLEGTELTRISPTSGNKFTGDFVISSSGENVKDELDKINGNLTDVNGKVDKAVSDLAENIDFVNQLSSDLESVKNQVDGAIESYFEKTDPTTSNYPASSWTTEELKQAHANDTYTNISTGKSWKWVKNGSTWEWSVITDTATEKALALAGKAQDTADGKRRVFVSTPTNASTYDVGDLWVNATYGVYSNDLLRCKTSKAAGDAWSIEHWELASRYTDDSKAEEALNAAIFASEAAENAQSAAEEAQADAIEANNTLGQLKSDNIISPPEKTSLKQQHSDIRSEYNQIIADSNKYSIDTTSYKSAYDKANAALAKYTASSPEFIEIEADYDNISAYYAARQTILNNIATAAKKIADDAASAAASAMNKSEEAIQKATEAIAEANLASQAAEEAKQDAANASEELNQIKSDKAISPPEKTALKQQHSDVKTEYAQIIADATKYNVSSTTYAAAYNKANAALTKYTADTPEYINISTDYEDIASYYSARQVILDAIAAAAKKVADDAAAAAELAKSEAEKAIEDAAAAQSAANQAKQDAKEASDAANAAKTAADKANAAITEMSSDNKLTATEKQMTKKEWDTIVSEKPKNNASAVQFGVPTSAYDAAYNALNSYITPLLSSLTATSDIKGTEFRAKWKAYYDARTDLLNAISAKAKAIADQAQQAAEDAMDAVDNIEIGGRNLAIGSSNGNGWTGTTSAFDPSDRSFTRATTHTGESYIYSHYIDVEAGRTVTLSFEAKWENGDKLKGRPDVYVLPDRYCTEGFGIIGKTYEATEEWTRVVMTSTADSRIASPVRIRFDHNGSKEAGEAITMHIRNVKLEYGNKATDWTPAPEDTALAIQEAQETADAAQEAADTAVNKANEAANRLNQWASDSYISPTEKLALKQERQMVAAEKDSIVADAAKYGVSSTDFVSKWAAYDSELAYHSTDNPENIQVRASFATSQSAYYSAYKTINGNIATAAKKLPTDLAENLDSYKSEVTAKFEATDNKISSAVTSSKEYTNEVVENIQIGGRNLIKNSKLDNSNEWRFNGVNKASFVEFDGYTCLKVTQANGGVYALRADTGNAHNVPLDGQVANSVDVYATEACSIQVGVELISGVRIKVTEANKWVRVHGIQTLDGTSHSYVVYLSTGGVTAYFKNVKCEIGNKATDWTPAPEDVTSSIDSVNNTLTTYKEETDSRLVVLEDKIALTVTSDMLQQTRTEILNSAATTAQSKADAAKQDAIADAAGKYVTTTTYTQKINQITSDLNGVSLKATQTETKVTEIDGEITSLENRVSEAEIAVQPDNIWLGIKNNVNQSIVDASKRTEVTVDATGLDENTYYPITIHLTKDYSKPVIITVSRNLVASLGKPSWSTHTNGFTVRCQWQTNGSGYGSSSVSRTILNYSYSWIKTGIIPIGDVGQMTNSSDEYIYVRGGSKYSVLVEGFTGVLITLRTSSFTGIGQTIDLKTEVTKPVVDLSTKLTEEQVVAGININGFGISVFGKNIDFTGKVTFSSLATDAQSKINTAVSDSSTALSTANTANTNASQAKTDASSAKSTATTAKNTADTAKSTADSAKQTATTANTNASTALSTANSAKTTATTALSTANTARTEKIELARLGTTIINGGYIKSELIEVDTVLAEKIGAASITTGSITVTDGAKIGNFVVDSNSLKNIDISHNASVGVVYNKITNGVTTKFTSILGYQSPVKPDETEGTAAWFMAEGKGSNVALRLYANGSTVAVNTPSAYGRLANLALVATGGCNWGCMPNDFWCMPGLLWLGRISSSGHIESRFGNGCKITESNGNITKLSTGRYRFYHNIGHWDYIAIPSAYIDGNYHIAVLDGISDTRFDVNIFHKDQGFMDGNFVVAIFGRPSING